MTVRSWRRYAALGDSFTEGLMDDVADGRHRGWADRVAEQLARKAGPAGIEYANLAIRGKLTPQVVAEQVPQAAAMRPDLVSLAVGVNDTLRPRFDLDAVATTLENGVRELRATGSDVLIFAFGDPVRRSPLMRPVRERIRALNTAVAAIAQVHGCRVASFWDVALFDDPAMWDADWLHLSPRGHAAAAELALSALGLGGSDSWRTPLVPARRPPAPARLAANARWTREHLAPWVGRRLRGESSGDEVEAKHPEWVRVRGPALGSARG